jgi:Transposase DDE domain
LKKELPMSILAKVRAALQQLFGPLADEAAQASGIIVRQRVFTGLSLARTFVLGFLQHPDATAEQLAQLAAQCGAPVTPQAIDQRQTSKLVSFLEKLFRAGVQQVVGSDKTMAPILERFTSVTLLDSTTITLPDSEQERFPGCGGSHGSGVAALKLQTELDLRSGALTHVELEPGRSPDGATVRQQTPRPAGSLRITDLGYFNAAVFAAFTAWNAFYLSRLQIGTGVSVAAHDWLDLLPWLAKQPGPFVDRAIWLGKAEGLACRLIAWRLPDAQVNRRRRKLHQERRRKGGPAPSAARLAWCAWTILVTNVPLEKLTAAEAAVLYRARWQIELLFKRWKSQDRVAVLSGSTVVRQLVRVWARLLAALVQHWLVVASIWGDPTKSLVKACEAVRAWVGRLAGELDRGEELERVLGDLCAAVAKTCRQNKRSKPSTFELLNDVRRLEFVLS